MVELDRREVVRAFRNFYPGGATVEDGRKVSWQGAMMLDLSAATGLAIT